MSFSPVLTRGLHPHNSSTKWLMVSSGKEGEDAAQKVREAEL